MKKIIYFFNLSYSKDSIYECSNFLKDLSIL